MFFRSATCEFAIKLHTVLDLRGNIPSFLRVTDGRTSDVSQLDDLPLEAGAIYVMDRGYVDFARLYRFTLGQASFVVRAKENLRFKRRYSVGERADAAGRLVGEIGTEADR